MHLGADGQQGKVGVVVPLILRVADMHECARHDIKLAHCYSILLQNIAKGRTET
jgi:hypothetical protein